jgi:hypothetical protein
VESYPGFKFSVSVAAIDGLNRTRPLDATGCNAVTVSIALAPAAVAAGARLLGDTQVTLEKGLSTFTDMSISGAPGSYALTMTTSDGSYSTTVQAALMPCPDKYLYDEATRTCLFDVIEFRPSTGAVAGVFSITGLAAVLCIVCLIFVILNRAVCFCFYSFSLCFFFFPLLLLFPFASSAFLNSFSSSLQAPVVKSSSFAFCLLIIVGGLIGLLHSITVYYSMAAPDPAICHLEVSCLFSPSLLFFIFLTSCLLQIWSGHLGFALMFGSLFVKTYRIAMIFNQTKLRVGTISYVSLFVFHCRSSFASFFSLLRPIFFSLFHS